MSFVKKNPWIAMILCGLMAAGTVSMLTACGGQEIGSSVSEAAAATVQEKLEVYLERTPGLQQEVRSSFGSASESGFAEISDVYAKWDSLHINIVSSENTPPAEISRILEVIKPQLPESAKQMQPLLQKIGKEAGVEEVQLVCHYFDADGTGKFAIQYTSKGDCTIAQQELQLNEM